MKVPLAMSTFRTIRYIVTNAFCSFLSADNHGKRESVMVERGKPAADIIIELLQSGHNNSVAAHPGNDFRHRMGKIGKSL